MNFQATASGSTSYLNLQGGTLSVTGSDGRRPRPHERKPADTSAQVNQSGGLLTAGGPMTIGAARHGPERL